MNNFHVNTDIDVEIKSPLIKKILAVVFIFVLMFMIIYPLFALEGSTVSVKTQTAVTRTVYETIDTEAFAVRKEVLIDNSYSGTVVPAVDNGSKVAIGDTVASIYSSDSAAESASRLKEIKSEIEYYKSIATNSATTLQTEIAVYKSGVSNSLFSLSEAIESDNLSTVYELSRSLREAIMKKQMATGAEIDVSSKISALEAEYASLQSVAAGGSQVTVSQAGYYVDSADGYEKLADYDNIVSYKYTDAEVLFETEPSAVSSANVGKLITDFNWYLVFNAKVHQLGNKVRGSYVTVIFGNSQVEELRMKIEAINQTEGSDVLTVVLSSNIMNEEIAALRKEAVKIRVDSLSGIAVDRMALRTVDGEKGVYVKEGNLVNFKKVNIIYSDESIVLSEPQALDSSYLAVYDEMILEGIDLYDSKLLD